MQLNANTIGQFANAIAPFLDNLLFKRNSSGLGSWTSGFTDTVYEPIEPLSKGLTLTFIFFSPIFEYLVFNYADNIYAKALEKFLRYQNILTIAADLGSLTLDSQSVSEPNFIKYKYPLKISAGGNANFTFVDYFYAFTCLTKSQCIGQLVKQAGQFFKGTFGQLAQIAGEIIGSLGGLSGFHSIIRPVFELWFDLFVPFNRQIFLAQRGITNAPKGSQERYIQLPKDTLQQLIAYSKLISNTRVLRNLLIFQPDLVYKANALIVQLAPDYNASVVNAYYIVGLYPTNYPLLSHDYNTAGLEQINVTFSYDYIFTGKDVLELAQQLVNTPLQAIRPSIHYEGVGSLTASIVKNLKQLVSDKKQPSSLQMAQISCYKSQLGQAPITTAGKIQGLVSTVTNLLSPGEI